MKKNYSSIFYVILISILSINLAGCAGTLNSNTLWSSADKHNDNYLSSGSIILSRNIPTEQIDEHQYTQIENKSEKVFAPLIGFFPPSTNFLPADNEAWLELKKQSNSVNLYNGKNIVSSFAVEGNFNIDAGKYYVQHKEKNPVWYAPDQYFAKRHLEIPGAADKLRYRRGALGEFAIYPSEGFALHSAAIWSEDVGGLKLSQSEIAKIFDTLSLGALIVVN